MGMQQGALSLVCDSELGTETWFYLLANGRKWQRGLESVSAVFMNGGHAQTIC